jgi:hypothetical protein
MKMQKLNSKQMPQVIGLSVLTVGVLGYVAYSFVANSGPPHKPAGPATAAVPVTPVAAPQMATANGPGLGTPAGPAVPGQYNPDPFRPAVKTPAPVNVTPPPAKVTVRPSRPKSLGSHGPRWVGIPLPAVAALGSGSGPAGPGGPGAPVVPAGPVRPEVTVTGVIVGESGQDMALVTVGMERRVLQVGDLVGNDYRVKRISMAGMLLANGKDRYMVVQGAHHEGAGKQPGAPVAAPTPPAAPRPS